MTCDVRGSPMSEQTVTYTSQMGNKLIVVEHVQANVCDQCGERLYSPETVERLQQTVWEQKLPSRLLQTPVFDFATQERWYECAFWGRTGCLTRQSTSFVGCLVPLVCLVHRVGLVQPNKRDRPNKPDRLNNGLHTLGSFSAA